MEEVERRREQPPIARVAAVLSLAFAFMAPAFAADPGLTAVTVTPAPGGGQTYSLSIQILLLMSALTLLPAGLIMMTSFTRIIIVLAILRQALGTAQTPTNQILIGLALFLTFFVMAPVFERIHDSALKPYMEQKLSVQDAAAQAAGPLKTFMLDQTRESDLALFTRLSGRDSEGEGGPESEAASDKAEADSDIPFFTVVPAFVTSELKTAFQIGFLLFIPFLIIDLVVASVLMSMGMMMLSPMMVSLPFKIMLFVLVDGWALIMGTLAASFHV
ncbi:MAG: flagellar biosynthesis protein FliP [Gammaproteobacteria bacterium]|nr:MAG: flagellar biosynthesis protein FliP [Gammaproteobacteria bacterium]